MHRQQARKQRGVSFKCPKYALAQLGVSIQEKKHMTHQKRPSSQTPMRNLVALKVVGPQGIG